MKKTALTLMLALVLFGCQAVTESEVEMELFESSSPFQGVPEFNKAYYFQNAELALYGESRANYASGPAPVVSGGEEYSIWLTSMENPEGFEKNVTRIPESSVLVFQFDNGVEGHPGYKFHSLRIELPTLKLRKPAGPDDPPRPRKFVFGTGSLRGPKACVYIKRIPRDLPHKERETSVKKGNVLPEGWQDPFESYYVFYSEKVLSGYIILDSRTGRIVNGRLMLTFKNNMLNALGHENQGSDLPEYRDFSIKGTFMVVPFGYKESLENPEE